MDAVIVPVRIGRRTLYRVGPCFFSTLKAAYEAVWAAQVHRLDIIELFAHFRASIAVAAHGRPFVPHAQEIRT